MHSANSAAKSKYQTRMNAPNRDEPYVPRSCLYMCSGTATIISHAIQPEPKPARPSSETKISSNIMKLIEYVTNTAWSYALTLRFQKNSGHMNGMLSGTSIHENL